MSQLSGGYYNLKTEKPFYCPMLFWISKLYNENDKYVTWEKSSLRAWLNKKFINTAFSDEEKEKINITEIVNQDNPVYGIEGGNNTFDKIFLLSLSEVSEQPGW